MDISFQWMREENAGEYVVYTQEEEEEKKQTRSNGGGGLLVVVVFFHLFIASCTSKHSLYTNQPRINKMKPDFSDIPT